MSLMQAKEMNAGGHHGQNGGGGSRRSIPMLYKSTIGRM